MVYGDVFRRIAEEEAQYAADGERRLPEFGKKIFYFSNVIIYPTPYTLHLCPQVYPQVTMKR